MKRPMLQMGAQSARREGANGSLIDKRGLPVTSSSPDEGSRIGPERGGRWVDALSCALDDDLLGAALAVVIQVTLARLTPVRRLGPSRRTVTVVPVGPRNPVRLNLVGLGL
jgi:hypothetical protein